MRAHHVKVNTLYSFFPQQEKILQSKRKKNSASKSRSGFRARWGRVTSGTHDVKFKEPGIHTTNNSEETGPYT